MRAHYLQHVKFEGPGSIEPWLDAAGYDIDSTRFFLGERLPDPDKVDLLVIMGGPMSVNDEAVLPWLVPEKAFVRACIGRGVPVLGICLGAQLIAASLGSRIYRNALKEIGWFPVQQVANVANDTFRFPASADVFHWHGETFDLPELRSAEGIVTRAMHLARSAGCERQAFQLGRRTLGLQFHLEVTPQSVREMIEHGRDELAPAEYVQTETDLLKATAAHSASANALMSDLLEWLTR